MKILGLIIIAITTATTNIVPLSGESGTGSSTAWVIETNSGQIAYVAQIESSQTQVQLDSAASVFRLTLADEKITDKDGKKTPLDYEVITKNRKITLTLVFDSYQCFYDYNGINLTSKQNRKIEINKTLFFHERTLTLSDPYTRFFDTATNKAAAILETFNNEFNESIEKEVDYTYIFASSFRRTEVNSDKIQNLLADGIWEYYFALDPLNPREIVIFDRFANTPIWYGVAVAATLLFMGGLYLYLKRRQTQNINTQSTSKQ